MDDLLGAGGGAQCTPGLHIAQGRGQIILETAHRGSYPASPAFCIYRAIPRCKVGQYTVRARGIQPNPNVLEICCRTCPRVYLPKYLFGPHSGGGSFTALSVVPRPVTRGHSQLWRSPSSTGDELAIPSRIIERTRGTIRRFYINLWRRGRSKRKWAGEEADKYLVGSGSAPVRSCGRWFHLCQGLRRLRPA